MMINRATGVGNLQKCFSTTAVPLKKIYHAKASRNLLKNPLFFLGHIRSLPGSMSWPVSEYYLTSAP